MDLAEEYRLNGYAIVKGLWSAEDMAALSAAVDEIHAEGIALGASFRYGNLHYRIDAGEVRMVQWPSYHNAVLDRFRTDPRVSALLAPMIGGDVKQIINQLHWKKPGGKGDFAFHQDSRFRKPVAAYRNLGGSYVQTAIAIDRHDPLSGGLQFLPGSHLKGDLSLSINGAVMDNRPQEEQLLAAGLDPAALIYVEMEPGDFLMWSPYLVHGSGTNNADHFRRFYINGYVRADDCDRGEWAFRGGAVQSLGPRPNLVHFEELFERPGPHFV